MKSNKERDEKMASRKSNRARDENRCGESLVGGVWGYDWKFNGRVFGPRIVSFIYGILCL